MIQPGHLFERLSNVRFLAWEAAAREAVERLREHVDWLIALSHRGVEDDRILVEICPEVDLVLGGHSHGEAFAEYGRQPTLISHAGCHAHRAAVIKAERSVDGRKSYESQLVEIG
jgi:2',3'-cyclic-nucleotide 2'-phosphodiesterase (5'-nucleotidase family)